MSTTQRAGGTQRMESSGDPWVNMTNYQRQQLLGTATAGLAGVGDEFSGRTRHLVGPGATSGRPAQVVEGALGRLLAPNPLEVPGERERGYLSGIESLSQRPVIDPLEARGLMRMGETADPTRNLDAARDYLQRISGPAIANSFTAAGMGRSGGVGEALAQEGTRMTLPILADSLGAQRALAGQEMHLGGQLRDRELASLQSALAAAEAPRMAQYYSETKPEQILLSSYGLTPQPSGAGSQVARISQWSRPSEFQTAMQVAQSVASIAGAFMCWVAYAVYGEHDPRFWRAWSYVNFDPSLRARLIRGVYRRVGRPLARAARGSTKMRRACQWLLERVIPSV